MKRITLIASDFRSLTEYCGLQGTAQYISNTDCPIARALKRKFPDWDCKTGSNLIKLTKAERRQEFKIEGDITEVERCRKKLLAGSKRAYIKVHYKIK